MTKNKASLLCLSFFLVGLLPACLVAQEEADRPAGEVTQEMLRRAVPKAWVGAGDEPGMGKTLDTSAQGAPLPHLLPTPQEVYAGDRFLSLGAVDGYSVSIELAGETARVPLLESELRKRIERNHGARPGPGGASARTRIVFALSDWFVPAGREGLARRLATLDHPEGYVISTERLEDADVVVVLGKSERALWRALATVAQLITVKDGELVMPAVEIVDHPQLDQRALIMDIGGQGFMVGPSAWGFAEWKDFIDWMVDQKLNEIWFEIIGSGRLMGNLNMEAGEWIGFPLALESYPELVCRDRPIRRWDEASQQVVNDKYTAPNVKQDFLRELIDYTQARGIKAVVFVGYDYFANQLPYTLGVPANDPSHPEANKVYDTILREIVQRYDNAQGIIFHTIENKNVPPEMVQHVVRRAHEGRAIVKSINPAMDVGLLNDYLEWRPRAEFDYYTAHLPDDVYQVYSPHTPPWDKAWLRMHKNMFRYELFTQYAWNNAVYVFPERIKREIQADIINGYRKVVSQAWYAGVFKMNFMTMAEMAWNSTGPALEDYWDGALTSVFGATAAPKMREAFAHTRFDRRLDIVGRMLMRDKPEAAFQFWDMYKLTNIPALTQEFLDDLVVDAGKSLAAAREALPSVAGGEARKMVEQTIISAERRLYMGTSAKHYLKARAAEAAGDRAAALKAMDLCIEEGRKLVRAATKLGIEFPMAVHDDDVFARYEAYQATLRKRAK